MSVEFELVRRSERCQWMVSINTFGTRRSAVCIIGWGTAGGAFASMTRASSHPSKLREDFDGSDPLLRPGAAANRLCAALTCVRAVAQFHATIEHKFDASPAVVRVRMGEVMEDKNRHLRALEGLPGISKEGFSTRARIRQEQARGFIECLYDGQVVSSILRNALFVERAAVERLTILLDGARPAGTVVLEDILLETRYHLSVILTLLEILGKDGFSGL